jgi:hypothetical protein
MKLKVLIDSNDNRRIATESGELIENVSMVTNHDIGTGRVTLLIYGTDIMFERVETVVEADEQSSRVLPAPVQDPFGFLKDCYDYDPDDYALIVREDEEDDENIMEDLCIRCAQELCLQCQRCHTPACEEEADLTDDCGT